MAGRLNILTSEERSRRKHLFTVDLLGVPEAEYG